MRRACGGAAAGSGRHRRLVARRSRASVRRPSRPAPADAEATSTGGTSSATGANRAFLCGAPDGRRGEQEVGLQRFVVHLFISVSCVASSSQPGRSRGSFAELSDIAGEPALRTLGFWPIWVISPPPPRSWSISASSSPESSAIRGGRSAASGSRAHQARRHASGRRAGRGAALARSPAAQAEAAGAGAGEAVGCRDVQRHRRLPRLAEEVGATNGRVVSRYREFVLAACGARHGEEGGHPGDGFLAQFPAPPMPFSARSTSRRPGRGRRRARASPPHRRARRRGRPRRR